MPAATGEKNTMALPFLLAATAERPRNFVAIRITQWGKTSGQRKPEPSKKSHSAYDTSFRDAPGVLHRATKDLNVYASGFYTPPSDPSPKVDIYTMENYIEQGEVISTHIFDAAIRSRHNRRRWQVDVSAFPL
jgi:hypothetical protein